ncbi:BNR-4 repeat-containing protein [Flammeovirga sp. OC4]|uniref:BNR-4 repeat-containing protein n=1 Tax=Flammeovirga sp. OC4 TaxID=1382345 RepID=UPI0006950226|nr:BNR-4 repeat-containing protein [Flammeovirga sp. OC4]
MKRYINKTFNLLLIIQCLFLNISVFGQEVDYFSNNALGNPIVGHAGEYYKGVTYVTYQGEKEDPYVAAYNHKTKKWTGPYKAGTSLLGKKPGKIDNHGKPTLVVDGEGYIHIVFGGHGGSPEMGKNPLGNYNCGKQIHVVSKRPMDISSWEVVDNLTPFATYSQFIKMDNGDIYLFFRHGAHRSNWVYQVSKDNCKTFSPLKSIVKAKPTAPTKICNDVYDSWYLDFHKGNNNDIMVAYNYHVCQNMRPHTSERHNCYYMKLDTEKDEWYNVEGEALEMPVTKEYADKKTIVINTGEKWGHIGRATVNSEGHPHVYWYDGEPNHSNHGGPKKITNYHWTGKKWSGNDTNLPVEGRGDLRMGDHPSMYYLLGYNEGESSKVAWWNSKNAGKSFSKGEALIEGKGPTFKLSNFIRNAHPDARIIATQKIEGTDYSKVFLLGDQGPIKRLKKEADILINN